MQLQINGKTQEFALQTPTLSAVLESLELGPVRGIAVAVNDRVIPRGQWDEEVLQQNDRIEIIRATQGG